MNTATSTLNQPSLKPSKASKPPRSARLGLAMLNKIEHGQLTITDPDNTAFQFGSQGRQAALRLNNWRVFQAALRSGDIGFAEAYIRRDWETDELTDVLNLLVENRSSIEKAVYGSWLGQIAHRIGHLMNRNSRRGARRNIHAHYDIGNSFYSMWLDPSMTYSSALFTDPAMSLEQAQAAKYQRMLEQAQCSSGGQILEIGCGWGGFAEVATKAGHAVRGLTLSVEQQKYARERLDGQDNAATAEFLLQDYRDETGQYDAIVSIEMFEAVGQQYWPQYFEAVHRGLKPGARAVVQTITIDESLFERYQAGTDFIQQYIFPGGMLPSIERFAAQAERQGLRVVDQHCFGQDYATTLRLWRESFMQQLDSVRAQGFDDRFIRTWEFYLAYCEAAFTGKNTNVCQFTLTRD
jgi:cyclopropane-fatty-acyl-phospholipid synthase